jgi:hypothetical protein
LNELISTAVGRFAEAQQPSFAVVSEGRFAGLSEAYAQIEELREQIARMEDVCDDSLEAVRQQVLEETAEQRNELCQEYSKAKTAFDEAQVALSQALDEHGKGREEFLSSGEGRDVKDLLEGLENRARETAELLEEHDIHTECEIACQQTAKTTRVDVELAELLDHYRGSDAEKHDNWVLLDRQIEGLLTKPQDLLLSRKNVKTIYEKWGVEGGNKKIQELVGASRKAIRKEIEDEEFVQLVKGLSWQFYGGSVSQDAQNSKLVQALTRDISHLDASAKTAVYQAFEEHFGTEKSREEMYKFLDSYPQVKTYIESEVGEGVEEILGSQTGSFAARFDGIQETARDVRYQYIQTELSSVRFAAENVESEYGSAIRLDVKKRSALDGGTWVVDSFAEALNSSPNSTFAGRSNFHSWPSINFPEEQEIQKNGSMNASRLGEISTELKQLESTVRAFGIQSSNGQLHRALSDKIESLDEKRLKTPFGFIDRFFNRQKDRQIRELSALDEKLTDLEGEGGRIRCDQETLGYRSNQFTQERKRISESWNRLPEFIKDQLDTFKTPTSFESVTTKLNEIKEELWGEPGYTTPPEVIEAKAQLASAKQRQETLERLRNQPIQLA